MIVIVVTTIVIVIVIITHFAPSTFPIVTHTAGIASRPTLLDFFVAGVL